VVVVAHDVQVVQIARDLPHVVGLVDDLLGRPDGGGQQQPVVVELLAQLLGQQDEVLAIGGLALPLRGILPVQVQSIEVVLAYKAGHLLDEPLAQQTVGYQRGVVGRSLVPAADGQADLQMRMSALQAR